MTEAHDNDRRFDDWLDRLKRARLALSIVAIVFAALWLAGVLGLVPALIAFAGAVAVALAASGNAPAGRNRAQAALPVSQAGNELIVGVLAGLPDPVVVLDRRGDVAVLNARASALAPALRQGEALSTGLRNPDLLDAVRRVRAGGGVQRVELYDQVPVERWYEAVVTPLAGGELMLVAFHDLTPLRRVEEMRADFVANETQQRASGSLPSCRRRRPAWRG
jgi:two-component system phosphate regulon sensor histidine kinase PhoR